MGEVSRKVARSWNIPKKSALLLGSFVYFMNYYISVLLLYFFWVKVKGVFFRLCSFLRNDIFVRWL